MLKSFIALATVLLTTAAASAQEMPAEYKAVLDALGRQGDFKDKVTLPRPDIKLTEMLAAGVRAAVNETRGNRR